MDPKQVFAVFDKTPEVFTRIPTATYRIQLHRGFTFRDAQALIPYLAAFGITDCYLSPFSQTATDSPHGYDIADHNQFSAALGTEADYLAFAGEARRHGLGQIADVVPNHMSIAGSRNAWWMDVLENGPASPYAAYFDIDWDPVKPELRNKVLLPILGDQYGDVLERQELRLGFADGAFAVSYFDTRLPIDPSTALHVLRFRLDALEETLGPEHPQLLELQSVLTAITHLPPHTETDPERRAERQRERQVIRRRLARLWAEASEVRNFIAANLSAFNGTKGHPESFELLDTLLNAQAYRLASWQVAGDEVNYRRFFDVNDLAAIRMEEPAVFAHAHGLLLRLVREGWITGLRIDHPDGLYAPAQYFAELQRRCFLERAAGLNGAPGAGEHDAAWRDAVLAEYDRRLARHPDGPLVRPFYVVAEKILTEEEELPARWRVHGTTGYDFLNAVNGLFVDPAAARAFDQIYASFLGAKSRFSRIAYEARKLVMDTSMASELALLGRRLARISERHRASRDFTDRSLTDALREIIACFPVYRTYVGEGGGELPERDRRAIERAVAMAQRLNPTTSPSIFAFIRGLLCLRVPERASAAEREEQLAFVGKFQQLTGPMTAKGVEDTAFYRYNRLVSLNEVGSNPARFGLTVEEFHRAASTRRGAWPASLSTTSTHDTKRSEDVRARINVLSEIPREWRLRLRQWHRLNRPALSMVDGQAAPDRNEEYQLYQTLLGAWPLESLADGAHKEFTDRIQRYMGKALREAKVHVSWVNARPEYDEAVRRFVATLLDRTGENHFLADFLPFQRRIAEWGLYNSLSQLLIKLTAPGIPDFYQGTELWDFSLVDPDNRRPVDFGQRQEMLSALDGELAESGSNLAAFARALVATKEDGRLKLYTARRALVARREQAALFLEGEYIPLATGGAHRRHLCAFARRVGGAAALTIVPRFLAALNPSGLPFGREVWADTWIALPETMSVRRYRNIFTGEIVDAIEQAGGAALAAATVFQNFPIALLQPAADGRWWTQWLRPVFSRRKRGEAATGPEPSPDAERELDHFVETRLPAVLPAQRWFGSKGRRIAGTSLVDVAPLEEHRSRGVLALVEVAFDTGPAEIYTMPLAFRSGDTTPEQSLGTLDLGGGEVHVVDAFDDQDLCQGLLAGLAREATLPSRHGALQFSRTAAFPLGPEVERAAARRVGAEQSNTSVAYGDAVILKVFRKLEPGTNLDREMSEFLTTRAAFANTPALAGILQYASRLGLEATVAVLYRFVPNHGDAWGYVVAHLKDFFDFLARQPAGSPEDPARRVQIVGEFSAEFLLTLRRLGAVTGALHAALASDAAHPAFAPEPITASDVDRWIAEIAHDAGVTLATVRERLDVLPPAAQRAARTLLAAEADLLSRLGGLALLAETGCHKIRIHGDYHLGQTLRTDGDFMIIDFEGEPARPLAERRAKRSPLKDVAGMVRSLDYAVAATLAGAAPRRAPDSLQLWGETWADLAAAAFVEGYLEDAARAPVALLPASGPAVERVLSVLTLGKALYEVRYEMDNRPTWLPIPIDALRRLLARPASGDRGVLRQNPGRLV